MRRAAGSAFGVLAGLVLLAAMARADVAIPPAPERHFNDYASLVPADAAAALDQRLLDLEKAHRLQLVVAIFPELPSPSLEDFTVRTAQAWGVGQKKEDNGVVLFVFVKDRKSRLEVGYGLEDKIPDAVAKRILQDTLSPYFKQRQYVQGLNAAITVISAAATGSYARTVTPHARPADDLAAKSAKAALLFVGIVFVILFLKRGVGRGGTYSSGGYDSWSGGSSGGWSSSSDSDFSSGGGSFGGGGASGDW